MESFKKNALLTAVMKQKLTERLRDLLRKDEMQGLCSVLERKEENRELLSSKINLRFSGIYFSIEERIAANGDEENEPYMTLLLDGISLPAYRNRIVNQAVTDLFRQFLNHIGINDRPHPCYFRRKKAGMFRELSTPWMLVSDFEEGEMKGAVIACEYRRYEARIKMALAEINRKYPTTENELNGLKTSFKRELGLYFVKVEACQ